MAYVSNIPQPTDRKRDSQPLILGNFQEIDTILQVNHSAFNIASQGKHIYVSLLEQAATPVTLANEAAIYAKESTLIGDTALFFRKEGNGTEYEFTSSIQATPGWTRLPSGILLKWGSTTATGLTALTLPVAADVPAFTTIFSVQLTPISAAGADADLAIRLVSFANPLQFNVYATARTTTVDKAVTFEYLIIGI